MAIGTVPTYLQNASHSASIFRIAQSAPFTSGGVLAANELPVSQQGTPNMSVILGPGRAQITGTSVSPPSGQAWSTQAQYTSYNDANLTLTIATSNPTNPRIDAVYIQIQDAFYSGATNTAVAAVATGAPLVSPVPPAIPANAILIAYIAVAANATTIVTANISYQASLAQLIPSTSQGLVRIIPTSVVGGTLGANGVITVSGASVVSINGYATTTYDNYVMIIDVTHSTAAALTGKLRAAGVDSASSLYWQTLSHTSGSAVTVATSSGNATLSVQAIGGLQTVGRLELFQPALPQVTYLSAETDPTLTATSSGIAKYVGGYNATTVFDGITLTPGAGTITGVIRIYGYNNN